MTSVCRRLMDRPDVRRSRWRSYQATITKRCYSVMQITQLGSMAADMLFFGQPARPSHPARPASGLGSPRLLRALQKNQHRLDCCDAHSASAWGQNRYPSPALACQLSPAADIDQPERLGQVRITKRLYELGPWASSGDRADSAPDRQPTTTTICVALDSLRAVVLVLLAAWHGLS